MNSIKVKASTIPNKFNNEPCVVKYFGIGSFVSEVSDVGLLSCIFTCFKNNTVHFGMTAHEFS